jgi:hypothetical protein
MSPENVGADNPLKPFSRRIYVAMAKEAGEGGY